MAGSVEYVAEDGRTATLALIQQYVYNQGSAWDYTLNYLDRFFEDASRQAASATGPDVHGGYNALIRTLGLRTGELHAAFARSAGLPAFEPVPLTDADVAALAERVRADAAEVLDRLARRRDTLPEAVRGDADRLLSERERLLVRIAERAKQRAGGSKTRVHGDYHLGQVLLVQNDFVITDFEGEPSRTMAERAQKHSPLKDVAGMLRSFDYAMHAALFKFVAVRPDAKEAVEPAGGQWQQHATGAFLDGYEEGARAGGLASPRTQAKGLLELFMLEKAIYELKYEVDNRPDWVRIPVSGLLAALARPA